MVVVPPVDTALHRRQREVSAYAEWTCSSTKVIHQRHVSFLRLTEQSSYEHPGDSSPPGPFGPAGGFVEVEMVSRCHRVRPQALRISSSASSACRSVEGEDFYLVTSRSTPACPSVRPSASLSSPWSIVKVFFRLHQQKAIGAVLFSRVLSRTFTGRTVERGSSSSSPSTSLQVRPPHRET